jgi:LEA14-like dessication related protein
MNKLRPYLLVGGIAAIGYALYRYFGVQMRFIKDVQYKVTGVKILSLAKDKVELEVTTQVFNASNVEFTIQEIDINVFLNGVNVAAVQNDVDIFVAPNGLSFFSFNFIFDPKSLGKDIISIATAYFSMKDLYIDVIGNMRVKSAFLAANVPYTYRNNLKNILKK